MIRFIRNRPWLWIVLGFAILIYGWVVLLRISVERMPETVPLKTITSHERP